MPSYTHLHQKAVELVESDHEIRVQWLKENRWIGYPRAAEIMRKLEVLLVHPRETRMPNMLIIGETNNGKSKIVEAFGDRHPADENPLGDHIIVPVLRIETPPTPSEGGFYSEILTALFEKTPPGSIDAKRSRVIQVLRGVQLKMLILDELQNILAGASIKQHQSLNMLKYLGNQLKISIVGCGTGDLLRAVSIDPQIQNRFIPELLPRWKLDKEFRQLLMSFERVLPLRNPSALHDAQLAGKILALCEGTIGELSSLLNAAAELAIKSGTEQITHQTLNDCGYVSPSDRTRKAAWV